MKIIPILEDAFHHDGRGPELQCVVWGLRNVVLKGFEYFNPEDVYEDANIKHLELIQVEAFSQASEEVHGNIHVSGGSKAAIFRIEDSNWLKQFEQTHLKDLLSFFVYTKTQLTHLKYQQPNVFFL